MAKDVNIHVKAQQADEAQAQLDKVARAARDVGDKTADGAKKASASTSDASEKLSSMDKVLGSLRSSVMGFIGGWLGLSGVQKAVDYLLRSLERVAQIQKEIYDRTVDASRVGQALEIQTGTVGKQQWWTQQALALQKAGGMASTDIAQQMLISMDIAFAAQGGVKSEAVRKIAAELAPTIGSLEGFGGDEVAKLFAFAGTAGIAPTTQAYQKYIAEVIAGYRAAKSSQPGQFLLGLQQGGTAYLTEGGTLTEAIAAYSGALSVMQSEARAANLIEQASRLSSGAYEKPRAAMEAALGVDWTQLSMNERLAALLRYVGEIPESERGQRLAAEGFPVELTTGISKLVSPEARAAMTSTRASVLAADPRHTVATAEAYSQSVLGRQRSVQAEAAAIETAAGPAFAAWQTRLAEAQAEARVLQATNMDRAIKDSVEAHVMAIEQIQAEIVDLAGGAIPSRGEPLREEFMEVWNIRQMGAASGYFGRTVGTMNRAGYRATQALERARQIAGGEPPAPNGLSQPAGETQTPGPVPVHIHYNWHNDLYLNQALGMNRQDLLIEPPDLD